MHQDRSSSSPPRPFCSRLQQRLGFIDHAAAQHQLRIRGTASTKLLFDVGARNLILQIQTSYYSCGSLRQLIADSWPIYDINRRQMEVIRARYGIQLATVLDLAQTSLSCLISSIIGLVNDRTSQKLLNWPPARICQPTEWRCRWRRPSSQQLDGSPPGNHCPCHATA